MDEEFPIGVEGEPVKVELHPCETCGRKFIEETLVKHTRICKNSSMKKRKVFDSSKMRTQGTEMQVFTKKEIKVPPSKKNNWRQKHEEFMDAMKAAREVSHAIKTGAPLPPPPSQKSRVNPDYVECPSCNRNFNEKAAERHIPWCKEKNKRLDKRPEKTAEKSKLNTRTQYKPPLPGSGGKKRPSPAAKKTTYSRRPQGYTSSPSYENLEDQFNDSLTLQEKKRAPAKVNGFKGRTASLERSRSGSSSDLRRNNSGDALRNRIRSEDEYEGTDSDDYHNGYSYDTPPRRTNPRLPHNKLKYENERKNSPLLIRTPTPPSSRRYSSESVRSSDSGKRPSKFCYECGTKYPVPHAKYCCECGTKRPFID